MIAAVCESILLDMGLRDVAYRQCAQVAHQATTNLSTLHAIAARYPEKDRGQILADLVAATPDSGRTWCAVAKDIGLLDAALQLTRTSPSDPRTLARAARDFATKEPVFALESGLLALGWMARGYGGEISTDDVAMAWDACLAAASTAGRAPEDVYDMAMPLCDGKSASERFVRSVVRLSPVGP
jgi:hypothetical protein